MKHKYKIILCMIIIAGSIALFLKSISCSTWIKAYEARAAYENACGTFGEMVRFCQKNQDELETVSDKYLSEAGKAVSQEQINDLCRKFMDNPKWNWLSDKMSMKGMYDETGAKKRLEYHCKSFCAYDEFNEKIFCDVKVVYIDEKEESVEEYMDEIRVNNMYKVNEHLYVLLMEWQYK